MLYSEAIAAVIEDTRRPNKETLIRRKILAAIKAIQSFGRFPMDLSEEIFSGAALTADSYVQSLTLPDLTRIPAYVADPDRLADGAVIDIVDYTTVLANPLKEDIAYQAGNVLQVKLAQVPTSLKLGVYKYLPTPADAATNWVLTDFGEQVVELAVVWMYRHLGEKEMASNLERTALSTIGVMVRDRIDAQYGRI